MVTKTDAYPDIAIPPGEYLAEEIEARRYFSEGTGKAYEATFERDK